MVQAGKAEERKGGGWFWELLSMAEQGLLVGGRALVRERQKSKAK